MEVLTQGPRIVGWETIPGDPVPLPVVVDDRREFPAAIVREVLEWLEATKATVKSDPINITFKSSVLAGMTGKGLGIDKIKAQIESSWRKQFNPLDPLAGVPRQIREQVVCEVSKGTTQKILSCDFRRAVATLTMHDPIVYHFRYLVAVDAHKRVIVGPLIGKTQTARLEVA